MSRHRVHIKKAHNSSGIRKSDISTWYEGNYILVTCWVIVASVVFMTYLNPELESLRIGILDSIVGAAWGIGVAKIAFRNILSDMIAWLLEGHTFRKLSASRISLDLDFCPYLFVGGLLPLIVNFWIQSTLKIPWPWCTKISISGFLAFIMAFSFFYRKWYVQLPR